MNGYWSLLFLPTKRGHPTPVELFWPQTSVFLFCWARTTVKPCPVFCPELKKLQKSVVADIATLFPQMHEWLNHLTANNKPCPVAAIQTQMEQRRTIQRVFSQTFPTRCPRRLQSAWRGFDECQTERQDQTHGSMCILLPQEVPWGVEDPYQTTSHDWANQTV